MGILVLDSGVGGLSVLRELRVLLPGHRYVYAMDDAGFPYGDWAEAALRTHLLELAGVLLRRFDPALTVIACNTASTLALVPLRAAHPGRRFVGTVPAIKPAAERTRSGLISVLATPGTVARQYTGDLIAQWAPGAEVTLVGSAALAGMAETHARGGTIEDAALAREVAPCFVERDGRRTDIVVLACTHYPFLVNRMRALAPWPVDWIDTGEAIARRAASLLSDVDTAEPGADVAWCSGGTPDPGLRRFLRGFGLGCEG